MVAPLCRLFGGAPVFENEGGSEKCASVPARVRRSSPGRAGDDSTQETTFFGFFEHDEGFDPGSERTLAAWMRHASRARNGGQPPE